MIHDGPIAVCTAQDVSAHIQSGWRLLDIREEDRQELGLPYTDQVLMPNNSYPVQVQKVSPPIVCRKAIFIFGKTLNEELATLHANLDSLRESKEILAALRDASDKRAVSAEAELKEAKRRNDDLRESNDIIQREAASMRVTNRKLEVDIGKLRKEIGEARFREIVEAK